MISPREFQIAGWSCRDVTSEDVRLVPLISGRGKQCRLLGTVGVARGLGDHDLVVKSSLVNCKEFLSCQPEVRVKKIDELDPQSVMIMASDGLWDVMPNDKVYEIIKTADEDMHDGERAENFCQRLAKNLILGNFQLFSDPSGHQGVVQPHHHPGVGPQHPHGQGLALQIPLLNKSWSG